MSATISIRNWKSFTSGALQGFFSVELPSGIRIHKCQLFEKNGKRWIGLPSEKFEGRDGQKKYTALVEFGNRDAADRFRDAVLSALEAEGIVNRNGNQRTRSGSYQSKAAAEISDEDIPF